MSGDESPVPDPKRALEAMDAACRAVVEGEAAIRSLDENERAAAERTYESATRSARKRLEETTQRIEEEYAERSASFEARSKSERVALERDYRSKRESLREKSASAIQKVRDRVKEELWLIDTVADADERQSKAAFDRIAEVVGSLNKRLQSAREEADQHWKFYEHEPAAAPEPTEPDGSVALGDAESSVDHAESAVTALGSLRSPQFAQRWALATFAIVFGVGGLVGGLALSEWEMRALPYVGAVIGALGGTGLWFLVRNIASKSIAARSVAASEALARAGRTLTRVQQDAAHQRSETETRVHEKREQESAKIRASGSEREGALVASRDAQAAALTNEFESARAALEQRLAKEREKFESVHRHSLAESQRVFENATREFTEAHDSAIAALDAESARIRRETGQRQRENKDRAERAKGALDDLNNSAAPAWSTLETEVRGSDHRWIRLGVLSTAGGAEEEAAPFEVPFGVDLRAGRGGLVLEHSGEGRTRAMETLRAAAVRVLTTIPPGKARLTIIDPVGLGQSFAGFMHLADFDDKLVNGRIWTDERHIEQRLTDLTEHMENVIQKYLRNEYATIDEYNARAGEIAEPYRFIVIADLPVGFNESAARRLASIISSGQRCGVYTMIATDVRESLPKGLDRSDLRGSGVTVFCGAETCEVRDDVLARYPLALDAPPGETSLTRIVQSVGKAASDASRVEVPFRVIAPEDGREWSMNSAGELRVPLGRTGATRQQLLTLGRGTAQHVLIAGKTGSGKSNLLHAIVTSAALWYGPDQVEMYLVDFKKGVEFKIYAAGRLPHARAIAIESDREFALSVLQKIDSELKRRGEKFREAGVQDLAGYRGARPGDAMPRTLLLIDEFQEFFVSDDALAQDASLLLDRLVRQGRAFGIHVLLGSQTLAGAYSLARSTMGQMAVRIALQCGEADSYLILGEENGAARLLSRPGEAIYNDAGGAIEANSPFQIVFLPDSVRDGAVHRVRHIAESRKTDQPAPIVFEGNESADLSLNKDLAEVVRGLPRVGERMAWLGDPVAIRSPTAAVMRRQGGSNLLIVGQREEAARGLFASSLISLAAQDRPGSKDNGALLFVLDSTPPEAPGADDLRRVSAAIGARARVGDWSQVDSLVSLIGKELDRRRDKRLTDAPPVYLFVFGLHRLRSLKVREDDFSFSASEETSDKADRVFKSILTEGPSWGLHVIAWCDTLTMLERMMERSTVREFGSRVLFQMSVTDSTSLIDTPAASGLGPNRAIFFAEDEGRIEKFRPYGMPSADFLDEVSRQLGTG